jgi:hypothetical protein
VVVELHDLAEVAVPDDDHSASEIVGLHEIVNPFADSFWRLSRSKLFSRQRLFLAALFVITPAAAAQPLPVVVDSTTSAIATPSATITARAAIGARARRVTARH